MNGIINVLKPSGMTSHDVVSFLRKKLTVKKVGHTGTLDPNAAGVLPICIGKATKLSQYLIEKRKQYRCELTLGKETDTQDKYGSIINESDKQVTQMDIERAFNSFIGNIEQIPPMYSAVKYKGKKLYEIARKGGTVKREPRKVVIYKLEIKNIRNNNKILFDVECSSGTYIRTLCNDIGRKLGTYGCMSFLLRTKVSDFFIEDANTLEEIEDFIDKNSISKILLPLDYPLKYLKKVSISNKKYFELFINGGHIPLHNIINEMKLFNEGENIRIYYDENFIGIGLVIKQRNNKYLKANKVFVQR